MSRFICQMLITKISLKSQKYLNPYQNIILSNQKLIHVFLAKNCENKLEAPIANYDKVKRLMRERKIYIIDVRNPDEILEEGKIPNSENLPVDEIESAILMDYQSFKTKYKFTKPNFKDEIYVYCRSGKRSTRASEILLKAQYNNVWNYKGSWNEWSEKNPEDKKKK